MPYIKSYADDNSISENDRLLGTDGDNQESTKNFRIKDLKTFFSQNIAVGMSAFEQWQAQVNPTGTFDEFLEFLTGPQGPQGPPGPQGPAGPAFDLGYKEYRMRLYQSGTTAPSIQHVFVDTLQNNGVLPTDPTYLYVIMKYNSTGFFAVQILTPIDVFLETDKIELSFSDNKCTQTSLGTTTIGGVYNVVELGFESRNSDGIPTNGLIAWTNLYLRLYN